MEQLLHLNFKGGTSVLKYQALKSTPKKPYAFILKGLLCIQALLISSCSLEFMGLRSSLTGSTSNLNVAATTYKFTANGRVNAIAHDPSGNTYLGGEFTTVNVEHLARRAITLNTADGSIDSSMDFSVGFNNLVVAIAVLADGSILYGGYFTEYRGQPANRIAKLDSAGNLDTTFSPPAANGFDNGVFALAVSGTDIYVGGLFTTYNPGSQSANYIAKLDSAGNLDTVFSPPASNGFNSSVWALTVSGTDIYVGGQFTTYNPGSQSANRIAKLDIAGNLDTVFSPPAANGFSGTVYVIAISGTDIYVGGSYATYNPGAQSVNSIAKLDSAGNLDTVFSPPAANGFDGAVYAVVISGTDIYLGGSFNSYVPGGFQPANRIAKLDNVGNLDTVFSPPAAFGFDQRVEAIVVIGTNIYVGGLFTTYDHGGGADSANRIAKLDSSGNLDTTFSPPTANGLSREVSAISVSASGTEIYVGGAFVAYNIGSQSINYIAKLDSAGNLDTTFSPPAANGFNGFVEALAISGTDIYVGGQFTTYNPGAQSANRIAKLDMTTGVLDTVFSPPASNGFNNSVYTLAVSGTDIFAGGSFTTYNPGTQSANRLAKLDSAGNLDTVLSPPASNGFNSNVFDLAISGTDIYVGGSFVTYNPGSQSANRIAKLDSTGNLDTVFSPPAANGFNSFVNAVAVSGTDIYVGGGFSTYNPGSQSATRIAKLDSTGNLDTVFSPPASNGFSTTVRDIVISGSDIYVGGSFTTYNPGTQSANRIAKLDSAGNLDTTFSSPAANGFDNQVFSLAVFGTSVYVGGLFTAVNTSLGTLPLLYSAVLDSTSGGLIAPEL